MDYCEAVVTKPVVDLHAKANAMSERVTQVILGTPLIVGREAKNWLWVTTPDAYRGWIGASATRRVNHREPRYASRGSVVLVASNTAIVYLESAGEPRESLAATVGTRLELIEEQDHRFRVQLPGGKFGWVTKRAVEVRNADFRYPLTTRQKIVRTARRFLGVPYLWGGTTPLGFDCSGLVQLTYRLNGMELPRDADMQFVVGRPIRDSEMEPADLVFFSSKSSGITHVGIFVGHGEFLHSSGREKGVSVTPFKERYYQSVFVEARKVWEK